MATPFSLSNYNRYKATINPAWPHPPDYNPTDAQIAGREDQVRQQFKAIDAKHAAALEAERRARAAEQARFRKQGGQLGRSGLYVTPQGNYLDPALEAQVAKTRGRNVRPSPATVNMAPVAKPVAPKSPGRGMTYDEAYGPNSTVVADRIAEEQRIARQRAAMQAGINKIKDARPSGHKAARRPEIKVPFLGQYSQGGSGGPGIAQQMQASSAAPVAKQGQYAPPPAPPSPAQRRPDRAPPVDRSAQIAGGLTGRPAAGPVGIPPSYVPSNQPAHSGGVVERMQEPLPRPPVTQYPGTYQDAVNGLRQSLGYFPDPASVMMQPQLVTQATQGQSQVSQPQQVDAPSFSGVYNPQMALPRGGVPAAPLPPQPDVPYGGVYNPQMSLPRGGIPSGPVPQQPDVPFSGVYNPQAALPGPGQPDLGPDFPDYVPVQPRQPLRRGGATLGDVANEYLVSAPASIAVGIGATIQDIKRLLAENKISRERYFELERAIYERAAQDRATQPQ